MKFHTFLALLSCAAADIFHASLKIAKYFKVSLHFLGELETSEQLHPTTLVWQMGWRLQETLSQQIVQDKAEQAGTGVQSHNGVSDGLRMWTSHSAQRSEVAERDVTKG